MTVGEKVCPVQKAGHLDSRVRSWLQQPARILAPYLKEGMLAVDFGCGPGFFTLEMARRVGSSGRVIAVDLQEGMLEKLAKKVKASGLADRIDLHLCEKKSIGIKSEADFILAFYVVHEVPDQDRLFRQLAAILKPGGHLLLAEPLFHVSKKAFAQSLALAQLAGFKLLSRPPLLFSKTALLTRPVASG